MYFDLHNGIILQALFPQYLLLANTFDKIMYRILIIAGIAIIIIMIIFFGKDVLRGNIAIQDYEIYVDPLIDKQSLFTTGRVTIQNTGSKSLENVNVNFGEGDTLKIGTLESGKKIIISPPSDNKMEFVIITADPDIFVSKAYREPPKMVGMMGS